MIIRLICVNYDLELMTLSKKKKGTYLAILIFKKNM